MIPYAQAKTITFKEVGGGGGNTPVLQDITIYHPADKTTFKVGDTFDITGLIIYGEYTDDFLKDVTLLCNSSIPVGSTFTAPYSGNVTFTYEGNSTAYAILVKKNDIPDDYREVDYLRHTGYGYLTLSTNWGGRVELDVEVIQTVGNNSTLIGRYNSNTAFSGICVSLPKSLIKINYSDYRSVTLGNALTTRCLLEIYPNGNAVYQDGTEYTLRMSGDFGNTASIELFSRMSSTYGTSSYVEAKIYGVKVFDAAKTNQTANYIPCVRKSDSMKGFYDTIGRNFVYSPYNVFVEP